MKVRDLKFTKEIKEKWLNALKSGEYKQVRGQLRTNFGHCCLGVLAEIHPDLQISKNGENCLINNGEKNDENCFITEEVGYEPFSALLTGEVYTRLYRKNDDIRLQGGDFSNVIPLIEELPTVD